MEQVHPLKAFREKQEPPLTQQALAALLGVSKAAISRWETRERQPEQELLPVISEKTGIPISELRPDLEELMRPRESAA